MSMEKALHFTPLDDLVCPVDSVGTSELLPQMGDLDFLFPSTGQLSSHNMEKRFIYLTKTAIKYVRGAFSGAQVPP